MSTVMSGLAEKASADKIQKIVVGAYIVNSGGEVLVLQRSDHEFKGGFYELPSGGVEKGESWEEALKREVMEDGLSGIGARSARRNRLVLTSCYRLKASPSSKSAEPFD